MSMSNMCFLFILKAIKPKLKGHMINRILHLWSFNMKFMKLAKASYINFIRNDSRLKVNGCSFRESNSAIYIFASLLNRGQLKKKNSPL